MDVMTNSISNVGSASAQLKSAAEAAEKLKTISEALDKAAPQETVKPQVDQLILSKEAETALATAEFDEAKVQAIKTALQEGNYPLNERRIAENFVAIERMIGNT
jgi:negative regulator of flagellin synthesis FlgM